MKIAIVLRNSSMNLYTQSIVDEAMKKKYEINIIYTDDNKYDGVRYWLNQNKKYQIDYQNKIENNSLSFVSTISIFLRRLINYGLFSRRFDQSAHYLKRYENQLPKLFRNSKILKYILRSKLIIKSITKLDRLMPASHIVQKKINDIVPDVVIISPHNKIPQTDIEYIKASKAYKIPTAIVPLSWDNLTSKGLINVIPDIFLAWNNGQVIAANKYHGMPYSKMAVVGAPVFDNWFNFKTKEGPKNTINDFLVKKVGLKKGTKYILYLGSAKNITGDESWLINQILVKLDESKNQNLGDLMLLVRPHPANTSFINTLNHPKCIVYPKAGSLPSYKKAREEMYYSINSAICVVGVNTSGMFDSIINNAITIALCVDAYEDTQKNTLHFKELVDFKCIEVADNTNILMDKIYEIMNGQDKTAIKRDEFIKTFIRPRGIKFSAGKNVIEELENIVSN